MIYEIKNMNAFAKSLGKQVAKESSFNIRELKSYITVKNIKNIIKKYAKKDKGNLKYYIDEKRTFKVCDEINEWLIGVDLARLAALDILECYWDNDKNEMVFMKKKISENKNNA